jgi:iron-sulfur cluster repair protein YtfE (RIC family)
VESTSSEYARFLAYGNQLIEIHIGLRDLLADLREGVVPDADLGVHCLAFCAAVSRHHTGEDTQVFPLLAERHPELRAFLAELERDHQVIAGLLTRVNTVAAELDGEQPAVRVAELQQELDALAAVLETHFIGEEKRLVTVLNAVDPAEGLSGLTA